MFDTDQELRYGGIRQTLMNKTGMAISVSDIEHGQVNYGVRKRILYLCVYILFSENDSPMDSSLFSSSRLTIMNAQASAQLHRL